eukprot:CAMPEP_0115827688 /NCGR_PEP_ID=MMETSP0287-20121206/178_1 /TAXON_ID=412157 /ORGANISM="Chrysochromulina rotalis, Strain UIO044" /LENGTH=280 /DNA_ID=CAMNT_0003280863 /DNA_START=109 /DNA_END=951 /DNA_ORIENTATION=-
MTSTTNTAIRHRREGKYPAEKWLPRSLGVQGYATRALTSRRSQWRLIVLGFVLVILMVWWRLFPTDRGIAVEASYIHCRPRHAVVAGQRMNCRIFASIHGEIAQRLPELPISATIADQRTGQVVEWPEAVQDDGSGTSVSLHATVMGAGLLQVNFSSGVSLDARFEVLPNKAIASATRLECEQGQGEVQVGRHVTCHVHFHDRHGNPTNAWPQLGPGLGNLPATASPLGTAAACDVIRSGLTGEVITGFQAAASGRAGIEVQLGEEGGDRTLLTAWVNVV